MIKRIVMSAFAGAVMLILWAFVANAILGLRPMTDMRRPANMEQVYQVLLANISTPGGYTVHSAANDTAPTDEPVFGIRCSGLGHASSGWTMLVQFLAALMTCAIAAALLSMASERVVSSYARRVLFVTAIGAALAIYGDLVKFDIGGYPARSVLLLAGSTVAAWFLSGLVIGRILRPLQVRSGLRL